jgi:hypothetical protein
MTMQFGDIAATTAAAGAITGEEILALRRVVWADGAISEGEAQAILDINTGITQPSREWTDFLVEALSVWLVDEQDPRGYIDERQAHWLIDHFSGEGQPATAADIELLANCLEKAASAPVVLEQFVLGQIEQALVRRAAPGGVTSDEIKLLRRIIFASGSEHTVGVSQAEAELLFRIKDATLERDNAPEWQALFVQGVANFLQGYSPAERPDRARETELEAFMNRPEPGLFGFLSRMGPSHLRDGGARDLAQLKKLGMREHLFADQAADAALDAQVTPPENIWLQAEIDGDGKVDAFEQALLEFLKQG